MLYRILFWISILWLVPLMHYFAINAAKFKKNIAIGVTFNEEGKNDNDVKSRLSSYKKQIKLISIILLIAVIPGLMVSDFWHMLTYWLVWIDMAMLIYAIPFYLCNRDLKKIKFEKNYINNNRRIISIDTDNIPKFKTISVIFFIIPFALSFLPLIWDKTLWILYVTSSASIALFWLMYRYFYRNRSEAVNNEKELTRVLTQIRHYNWSKMWLISSYDIMLLSFSGLIFIDYPIIALISVLFLSIVVCIEAAAIEIKVRKMQEKLTIGSGTGEIIDDDDKWIAGIFYYNPHDSKLLVNERIGMNGTVNLAHTAGKVIMGITLIFFLAMPFTGVALKIYYEKPIEISVNGEEISADHGITRYKIKLKDINKVEIIKELPKKLFRVSGTSTDNMLKGNFRSGKENMKLLLNPEKPPFLKITEKNGDIFIFGFKGNLQEIYGKLKKR